MLASLRTTALVESAQWDRGKRSMFHPLHTLRPFSLCFAFEFLLPPFFLKSLRGTGGREDMLGTVVTVVGPSDL